MYAEVPPRVEYRLTELRRSINEPLAGICEWTVTHGQQLARTLARRQARRGDATEE